MPENKKALLRRKLTITGQVQGVGFRPFVYRIALDNKIAGSVRNTSEGVVIKAQAGPDQVEAFERDLREQLPPLARIVTLDREDLDPDPSLSQESDSGFEILMSSAGEGHQVLISPDTATCPDCLADMSDPENRRYGYPFTNCTNCGPRYTITRSIPYDRDKTSMACFPLCPECAEEYSDPLDRRFHAQPNACPVCGPHVWLAEADGTELARDREALQRTAEALARGRIMAIKGLGGFHLACDAVNHEAVMELRSRKNRWDKPLAVMVPDMETARRVADISEAGEAWLTGNKRPIVLCPAKTPRLLSPAVAPDTEFIGVMLPYTPLHHELLRHLADTPSASEIPALVMTSGNMSSEPIALGNREALKRLGRIADRFLFHNRDILIRTDDSVLRVLPGVDPGDDGAAIPRGTQFFRRARGFTPSPVFLAPDAAADKAAPCVLGVGPELKNTLCLTKNDQAFVSQHIGDMENLETFGFFREIADHLQAILQVEPVAVVRDLHPNYMSTRYALERGEQDGLLILILQHHYAHIHSVLAEHKHQGPALGLALDGTGYGEDATLWGGECLFVDTETLEHERLAHFSPAPLPGGEAAIREPWRTAQGFLWLLGIKEPANRPWPWLEKYGQASALLPQLLEKNINCPITTSCGRLFDAVSAMLGVCTAISYEGQAAILLENVQAHSSVDVGAAYACPVKDSAEPMELDTLALFAQVLADWEQDLPVEIISRRFHLGLIRGLADMAQAFAARRGTKTVALSGGVMQNLTLSLELPAALEKRGLTPLTHRRVPPNDACISLGQAAWGRLALARD